MTARLLMTTDAVGGVWRYAIDLARGLGAFGVRTTLLGFGPGPTREQRDEAARWVELRWSPLPLDWTAPDRAALAGVPGAVARAAEACRADVVQVNAPSQAAALACGAPVVAAAHSCVTSWHRVVRGGEPPADWAWRGALTREGMASAAAVVAPSRSFARLLIGLHPGVGRIEAVPNASALRWRRGAKQPFAWAAARWWDEGKNAATLDAAAALCRTPIHAAGSLTGPDGGRVAFRHARALGPLDAEAVARLGGAAQVFVSPSLYEPFGLAALEAARLGAALVLADIPTYREIWDGAALFADPRDPAAFAGAIDRLAADDAGRAALARAASRRAARFTLRAQAERMLAVYAAAARATGRDMAGAA